MVAMIAIPSAPPPSRDGAPRIRKPVTTRTWQTRAIRVGGVVFYGASTGEIGFGIFAAFDGESHAPVKSGISRESMLAELNLRLDAPDAYIVAHPTYAPEEN